MHYSRPDPRRPEYVIRQVKNYPPRSKSNLCLGPRADSRNASPVRSTPRLEGVGR